MLGPRLAIAASLLAAAWVLPPALAGEDGGEEKGPSFEAASKEEEARLLELLSKIPMPPSLKADQVAGRKAEEPPPDDKPPFEDDPAAHLARTPEEKEALEKKLAAMPEEERAKFLAEKKAELDARAAEEKRKRLLEGRDFAGEGVAPSGSDLSEEDFRNKLAEVKARHEAEARAKEARKGDLLKFVKERELAVAELKKFGEKATPYVARAFESADGEAGWFLVEVAASVPADPRAHEALLAWFDRQPFLEFIVDAAPMQPLSKLRTPKLVESLEKALGRAHWKNRVALAGLLFASRNGENADEVSRAMIRFLETSDGQNRPVALNFLTMLVSDADVGPSMKGEIIGRLKSLIKEPAFKDLGVTITAALGASKHPEAVTELRRILGSGDGRMVLQALRSLGRMGDPGKEAVPEMVRFLERSYPPALRREAAVALGALKAEEAAWGLIDMLYDTELKSDVKQTAASALARITGKNFGMNAARWADWWEAELKGRQGR